MSGHTPGPWFVTGSMTKYVEARIGGGMLQEVAACGPTEADDGYGEHQQANANLIAAAPDLLEACVSSLEELKKYVLTPHPEGANGARDFCVKVMHIEAAIAKARGEQA